MGASGSAKRPGLWWRLARGLGMVVAACLVVEAMFSLLLPQPVTLSRESVGGTTHLKPNTSFTVETDEFRNTVVTNSLGFHDREHAFAKPQGVRRVLVLGDSMVEAVQVPTTNSFCSLLEKALKRDHEVVNMGIAGAGQAQEILVLREHGFRTQPDVVVLMVYAANDVFNNSYQLETKKGKPFFVVAPDGSLELRSGGMSAVDHPLLASPLWGLSHAYRYVVRNAIIALETRAATDPKTGGATPQLVFAREASASAAWKEAWLVTEALIEAMDEEVRAQGAQLLVVLLPGKVQVNPEAAAQLGPNQDWDVDAPHARLMGFCQNHRIACVDLAPAFRLAVRQGAKPYFARDEHLTVEGHALVARLLAETLRARGE